MHATSQEQELVQNKYQALAKDLNEREAVLHDMERRLLAKEASLKSLERRFVICVFAFASD